MPITPAFVTLAPVPFRHGARQKSISACASRAYGTEQNAERKIEIAICTGPSCTKEGSDNTKAMLCALVPGRDRSRTNCTTTGCLGSCGSGPNAVLTVGRGSPQVHTGVRTVHAVSNLLGRADIATDESVVRAIEKKHLADILLTRGEFANAIHAYQEAADALAHCAVLHRRVLCNWSAALAACGRFDDALDVANRAVDQDAGHAGSWKRKAEAHAHKQQNDLAVSAWQTWGRLTNQPDEARRIILKLQLLSWFRL